MSILGTKLRKAILKIYATKMAKEIDEQIKTENNEQIHTRVQATPKKH